MRARWARSWCGLGGGADEREDFGIDQARSVDAVAGFDLAGAHQRHPTLLKPFIDGLLADAELLAEADLRACGSYSCGDTGMGC